MGRSNPVRHTKPARRKDALHQFKSWTDATGPDALCVEILFKEEGYEVSFGTQYQHFLWRTIRIQKTDPQVFGISYIKRMDSRHEFLDRLADYSKHPIAPVVAAAGMLES